MKFDSPENRGTKEIFAAAREKAEAIISNIDPDLKVSISEMIVSPTKEDDRKAIVLFFEHTQNPSMRWTMDIEPSEEYLEKGLEEAIKKAYRHQAWQSGDLRLKKNSGLIS